MARTAIATLQTIWDCRWSQPGQRLTGVPDAQQPEGIWVCVREGTPRTIHEEDCETCPHWELQPPVDRSLLAVAPPAAVTTPVTAARRTSRLDQTLYVLTWACIVLTAMTLGAAGLTILSSPLAIPFAIMLWLVGAAMIAFAVTGHLLLGR